MPETDGQTEKEDKIEPQNLEIVVSPDNTADVHSGQQDNAFNEPQEQPGSLQQSAQELTAENYNLDQTDQPASITWQAPEFISHDKTPVWYLLLLASAFALAAVLYLLTSDTVTAGVVIVAAIIMAIYASNKPKIIGYSLNQAGFSIGNRSLDYEDFRCFSVNNEVGFSVATLMPMKRFAVPASLYYKKENEEATLRVLSLYLPYEEKSLDLVDRAMRKLKF
jgi:hypothetical protein